MFSDDCNKVEFNISTNITTSDYTYILYNPNINILHLILFHDLNIDKVLIYLLYIYYILDENNRLSDHYSSIENYTIRYDICNTYILILIIKYYCSNVINTFNFNKLYIFDYSFS